MRRRGQGAGVAQRPGDLVRADEQRAGGTGLEVEAEAACLDRPIVSYAPDRAAYRASRGTYVDLLSGRPGGTPGTVATTEGELLEVFRSGEWRSAETTALRAAFRERFCPYDDGRAAECVVRRLFLDGA
ncbi:CDP-glycerol glycerophosphotransferase family protein [Streptomyces sp. NPDC048411]|uniref:CDP-glycerol glycerophosphotransferase family protein n=1 Tax=Streptomyces sp. NPDC048411 TaxID=3157206 RepID=UPI003454BA2B